MKTPIDLTIKTMTCKVSAGAQDRLKLIASRNGLKVQDVLSACLLYMPEDKIIEIVERQQEELGKLSPEVQSMLKKLDKLSADERKMLLELLS